MRPFIGLFLLFPLLGAAPAPSETAVTSLRIESRGGSTALTIAVNGEVAWKDFSLNDPPRVVVDIPGARIRLPDGARSVVSRGGVSAVRTSQYQPNVVRVVVDLDRTVRYSVERVPEGIRISLAADAGPFEPWSSGSAPEDRSTSGGEMGRSEPPTQPRAARAPENAVEQRQQQPAARRITVSFQEANMLDVLATFAEFSGRSIIPGAGVSDVTVTADINNQPWDIALETILRAHGLAYEELPSGIIRVEQVERMTARRAQEPLVTRTFRVNYIPVDELRATLEPLKSERGSVSVNPTTNTLIVTDVGPIIDNIASLLPQLDIRTPQVSIQTKIIFVNRTDVEELGVTYDLKDSRGNALGQLGTNPDPDNPGQLMTRDLVTLGGNSIAALGNANSRVTGASLQTLTSLVLGRYTLLTFLDALQTAELSDVQAAPLITTVDNREAEIWVGERTPIRVVDMGGAAGGGGGGGAGGAIPRATAQLVETGIRLRVTPTITADRRILMQLHAERSSAQLAATDIGVVFQTQQGVTRLMVRDGETAVIGGLTVTELATTRAGIPFLMDLPYVGSLFRTTRRREQKRDLLIMVTPHIVEDQ